MKNMKKVFALVLVAVMVLALSATAFAQTVGGEQTTGKGQIVVSNAANGEHYKVVKLFDATVSADGTSIAYTGTIPAGLTDYFEKDDAGNIKAKDAAWKNILNENNEVIGKEMSDGLKAKLNELYGGDFTDGTVSDGTPLYFNNLDYGYYVVCTTQGDNLVSVDSTNPVARVIDKNTTPPISNPKKYANNEEAAAAGDGDNNVNIGDTVTYTIEFGTANYEGDKQITSYIISDNFASGVLTNVHVSSITIGGVEYKVNDATPQFDSNNKITIPWVDANEKNIYANGAKIVITYTATVADTAAIDGAGNKNTATITYTKKGGDVPPPPQVVTVEDTIYTYAFSLKKVDQTGKNLSGAKFQLPFYVKETPAADGAYIYAGTAAGEGLVNELTTPENGLIIVKGVKSGTYSLTEIEAPKGYNKLTAPVTAEAVKTGSTTTTKTTYLDANGNVVATQEQSTSTVLVEISNLSANPIVVVNKTGAELPETGGIGTTIFYVVGGLMMAAAVVLLITKKRVGNVK